MSSILLPNASLYDSYYDVKEKGFYSWDNKLSENEIFDDVPISKLLIPTTDTVKYFFLIKTFESKGLPLILIGNPGTAKTVCIENYIKSLD